LIVNKSGLKIDTGHVYLYVQTTPGGSYTLAASTTYGDGSTPSSVAEGLAAGVQPGSPVSVTAVDDALSIQATSAGGGTNYAYYIQGVSNDPTDFPTPSFPQSTITGTLSGGANSATGQQQTIYSYSANYDNDNNVQSSSDAIMGSWQYGYDTLNRLSNSTAGSGVPSIYAGNFGCWAYDAFGNRTMEAMSTTACGNNPPLMSWAQYNGTVNGTNNNQMSATSMNSTQGQGYDPAGNIINDGANQYLFDAEGRVCAVENLMYGAMNGYIYNASGSRVSKGTITTWSCDPGNSGFVPTSDFILGPNGEQETEVGWDANNTLAWQHTNVFAGSRLIAT
jgi:YD repeat-containing protein